VGSYDRALALAPDTADAWRMRGAALCNLRRLDEAVASFDRALAIAPGLVDVQALRADILSMLRRFDEALAGYEAAALVAPADIRIQLNRAVTLHTVQRFDDALTGLDRASAIDPDDPTVLFARARLLCEMNRISEGMEAFGRRAKLLGGASPAGSPQPEHKRRHDREQRAYLAEADMLPGSIVGGDRIAGPAVNPAARHAADAQWREGDVQLAVVDGLLTQDALEALRRFCWGSAIWGECYDEGYLGALNVHGFASPLLAQIAEELRGVFPSIIGEHGLMGAWAFKYDSCLRGTRIHADSAAVNVNFWITPDEANLNPESGGLVVWDVAAPAEWEFNQYNGDEAPIRRFLDNANARPITVPYRCNRAVIFNSDLFHETDRMEFRDGYLDRRINITMLFGRRTFISS
jgi:hypothetical protein